MPDDSRISQVSDTALMVAACRALETKRPDGMIRDPFAERLAGERGIAIAQALPDVEVMCFGVGMRSRFLDDLLTHALSTYAIETVVSIGAGLDTRPWRMKLPAHLRWIELDFPEILDYKGKLMASAAPACRIERMAADLNDAAQRRRIYSALDTGTGLMIVEGVLPYLPEATVESLARESATESRFRYCLLDMTSSEFIRRSGAHRAVQHVRDATGINGDRIREILERYGWTALQRRSYISDVFEIAGERIMKIVQSRSGAGATPPPRDDMSGVYLMGRA